MEDHFADRLTAQVVVRRTPVVVGLDPQARLLPAGFGLTSANDVGQVAEAYESFCRGVIDVVGRLVPAVKLQAAFFEQLGWPGMVVMRRVIDHAHQAGLLVIVDGKRNDIGSTAEAYADGYLGAQDSPWAADALTVGPYLGEESLVPFINTARARAAGLFVLVRTSNPGSGWLQELGTAKGQKVYQAVAARVEALATEDIGKCGYGFVGAVIGATLPTQLAELRSAMPHTWFLVPGYGAQGAGARDVAAAFDSRGLGAVINSSRAIIFAHQRPFYRDRFGDDRWQDAIGAAAEEMISELAAETPAARLQVTTTHR